MLTLPSVARLVVLAFAAFLPVGQSLPTHTEPMRNTFVVAAESVIDAASAADIHATENVYRTQIQQALTARETLNHMAEDDREHEIAAATSDLLFAVQACRFRPKEESAPASARARSPPRGPAPWTRSASTRATASG